MSSIHLRALEPTDIDSMYRWENDETLWTTSNAHAPFSKHMLTQYIIESQHYDLQTVKQLRLVIEDNRQTVGCIDLCNVDVFNHRAEIGILIDKNFRRKGYATAAILGLCEYCKQHLQMHQLCAEILTENEASLRLFEKCGFSHTGTKKDWLFENEKWKDVEMYYKFL